MTNNKPGQFHPAQEMWQSWIAPEHLQPETIVDRRDRVHRNTAALVFEDFFLKDPFAELSQAVRALHWERMHIVRDDPLTVRAVSRKEFVRIDPTLRFSSHDRAIDLMQSLEDGGPIAGEALRLFRFFFAFTVMTPALSSWVSGVLCKDKIKATSVEFTRYDKGDFIAEHTDVSGRRVANLVIYFQQSWPKNSGGNLLVKDRTLETKCYTPQSNTAVLLSLDPANSHWVSPWRSGTGRYTMSISFSQESP